tara:strand:- start:68266 stop:68778 length:513 start_codon:yes stop_codon:yes gene_type:complete
MFKNEALELAALNTIQDLVFTPVSRVYLYVLLVNNSVQYLVLCLLLLIANYWNFEPFMLYQTQFIILLVLYMVLHSTVSVLAFKRRKYALRTYDISFKSGLIISSLTTVPLSRIQHLDISQGMASRFFGLANVKLYTAGDDGSDMVIKGLLLTEAEQLKEHLSLQIHERF